MEDCPNGRNRRGLPIAVEREHHGKSPKWAACGTAPLPAQFRPRSERLNRENPQFRAFGRRDVENSPCKTGGKGARIAYPSPGLKRADAVPGRGDPEPAEWKIAP